MSAQETPPHVEVVEAPPAVPVAAPAPALQRDESRPRARRETRTSGAVVREVLSVLTSTVRARAVTVDLDDSSAVQIRDVRLLRRSLLVILADTVATTRRGGTVAVRTRDLAGGRIEIVLSDASEHASVVDRAAAPDRSGRASTLLGALEDLERAHGARIVAEVVDGRRRVLMDVRVPVEP